MFQRKSIIIQSESRRCWQ